MRAPTESERDEYAVYLGNGEWNLPRAATMKWEPRIDGFLEVRPGRFEAFGDMILQIFPLGFVGEQTSFQLSWSFMFDDPKRMHWSSDWLKLEGHYHWIQLKQGAISHCSWELEDDGGEALGEQKCWDTPCDGLTATPPSEPITLEEARARTVLATASLKSNS